MDARTDSLDAERLNLALAAARLGDWSWDTTTDVVTLSARAAEILAVPPGLCMTWTAMREGLIHPEDRERTQTAVMRAIAERSDYSTEYRVASGTRERWVSASGRARYDEHGAVLGMFGFVQDITRDRLLVRVDDALRTPTNPEDIAVTAARMLAQHLAADRCAYAFVDDDEDGITLTGNYTHRLPAIGDRDRLRQYGAACQRLLRTGHPFVVKDSEADPRIDANDLRVYQQLGIRSLVFVPLMKSGRLAAAMAVHTPQSRGWESSEIELVQQVASRCWESTERARVEQERGRLLEAAEAANRAKDEFLAMLGHELRNPLAPIVTALQLMRLRGDTESERERTVIERQVDHLTRLVDDLLDVSRIARGKVELRFQVVEIADIVGQAIEIASPLFERRDHVLEVDVPASGLAVDGDPGRLTQVVSNLLTNAGKYTAPKGHISVSARAIGSEVVLRVKDSGMGMPPDVLPRVFDLFVQGRQASDRAQGGLGLGLTIVKSLVQRHGGAVEAHSEGLGKGSELVVRLPLSRTSSAFAVTPSRQLPVDGPGVRPIRVLVVDDNEDAAQLLASALSMRGCTVAVAHDGPQALKLAAQETEYDLALLDIGLPVMDGYELASRLSQLPQFAHAQFVAVTGYGQSSDRERAMNAGFQHHFVKPVDLRELEAIVADLRDSRS